MTDPLAGRRDQINRGELDSLEWPDDGRGAPVEAGESFTLRRCWIEITGVRRVKVGREFYWRAGFVRTWRAVDRTLYLRRKGGLTDDPDAAERVQDPCPPRTIVEFDHDDRPVQHQNLGAPPEPAVDPAVVRSLPLSRASRDQYDREMAERRAAFSGLPVELRLAHLRRLARDKHVDISAEERVIERRIAALEARLLDREAA